MPTWQPVVTADFSTPNALDAWRLEGSANVSITPDSQLLIDNVTKPIDGLDIFRSTLWYHEPIWGDLKFELDVKGQDANGNIWFFNAQPLQGHQSIFDWQRPQANYVDYTGDPRLQMYTLGILRAHQDEINFRYLGGSLAYLADPDKADAALSTDPDHQFDAKTRAEFEAKTIAHAVPTPFHENDTWYTIELTAIGNHIQVSVNGSPVMDYLDTPHANAPLRGGYFGFRNFALTKTWCRALRVSKLA